MLRGVLETLWNLPVWHYHCGYLLRRKGTFVARKSQVLDEACYSTEIQTVT